MSERTAGTAWGLLALYSLLLSALMPYIVITKSTSTFNFLETSVRFPALFLLILSGYGLLFLRRREFSWPTVWLFGGVVLLLLLSWFSGFWLHYVTAAVQATVMLWHAYHKYAREEGKTHLSSLKFATNDQESG